MLRCSAILATALLGSLAFADEPPPKPAAAKADAPSVMPPEKWSQIAKAIADSGDPLAARLVRLRAAAAACLVERHGKIRQIALDVDGVDPVFISVCPPYGGAESWHFDVGATDLEAVKGWRQWDRLTWRERPRVSESGAVSFEAVDQLAAFGRTRNPGFIPPPQEKPTAGSDAFSDWIDRFAALAYAADYSKARAQWEIGTKTTWIIPANVVKGEKGDVVVHLQSVVYASRYKQEPTGEFTRRGVPIMHTVLAGTWGFEKWADLPFTTDDPQGVALMTPGTRANVAVDLPADGVADAYNKSPFRATIHPWKITGKM